MGGSADSSGARAGDSEGGAQVDLDINSHQGANELVKAMMHWLPILWHHIMALAPGGKVGTGHPGSDGQENNEAERAVLGLLNLTARCVKQVTEAMPDTRLDLTFIDTTDTTDSTDATYASGAPAPDSLPATT